MNAPATNLTADLAALRQIAGNEAVSDDLALRTLYSQDIWREGAAVGAAVATPTSLENLSQIVAEAGARKFAIAIRGGGMSYTAGYVAESDRTLILDLSALNQVVEINAANMTVTVQAGCTWKTLYEALKPLGLRTPFWGPLSGIWSTIGGGLSQLNAIFGAGQYGTTSESVVGLKVVLADGSILTTGAAGRGNAPFYRHYGPDLTGLFCGDCGVFGVKAEITLRLMRLPGQEGYLSFAFADGGKMMLAGAEIARSGVSAELVGFDPTLAEVRLRRASILSGVKAMGAVVAQGKSLLGGLGDALKIAVAGRGFLEASEYSLHLIVEGRTKAGVEADLAEIRHIVSGLAGRETEPSIPKVLRAQPFTPLNNILGPDGERWVPVHGIVALSDAEPCFNAVNALFDGYKARFDAMGIYTGLMLTSLSTNAFLIEPVFFWPEARLPIHDHTVEPSMLAKLKTHAPNPEATALVAEARKAAIDVFQRFGAAHFQIGRTYPWLASRDPASQALVQAIKAALDPERRMNPGGLGL